MRTFFFPIQLILNEGFMSTVYDGIYSNLVFTCATAFIHNGHFTAMRHAQVNQNAT